MLRKAFCCWKSKMPLDIGWYQPASLKVNQYIRDWELVIRGDQDHQVSQKGGISMWLQSKQNKCLLGQHTQEHKNNSFKLP